MISVPDGLIERLCVQWGLALDAGQPGRGDWNLVLLAHRGDEPCVLRVSGPEQAAVVEAAALRTWSGRGAIRLLEEDPQALLLERLDPERSLANLSLFEAAEIAGRLARELSVPAPSGLPRLVDVAREIADTVAAQSAALGDPLPAQWVTLVRELATELAADDGTDLVHGDLHYENILAGTREPWLAIDPKPAVGHPERSVAELMWTRLDEADDISALLARLIRAGDLDAERTKAWTIVRTASYWLWGLSVGLTEDPVRCQRLLSALIR